MPFSPKDWRDFPDTSTPLSAVAIEDLESRLGIHTDQAAADDFLARRNVAGRARDAIRKALVRNDFTNPRAVGLTNWSTSTISGSPTGVALTDVDDTDFILGADYTTTGHCAKLVATNLPSGAAITVNVGAGAGVAPTVVVTGQLVFFRAKVKVVSCPVDSTVGMAARFTDAAGANGYSRIIHTKQVVNSGDIFNLEGFIVVPATVTRASAIVNITGNAGGGGAVDMRVGNGQITIEPEGDVPECVDGYRSGGTWDGTADASTSYGYVWPPLHDATTFRGGFNYFHAFHNEPPIDDERLADVMVELGLTHMRLSIGTGAKGVDGVWPSNTGSPDWSQSVVWPVMQALHKRGFKYLPLVGVPTTWMTTDGSNFPSRINPTFMPQFLQLHTSLLDQAPDNLIDAVEVWNEPNLSGTDPGLTPSVYTSVLSSLYTAIKAQYPAVKVVGGSLAAYQSDDGTGTSVLTYLRGMYTAGAKTKMDAIAVHPYGDDTSTKDSETVGGFHSGFDLMLRQVDQVKHENSDDAKPIWITEYGWNTTDGGNERSQMQTVTLQRGRLARTPHVEAAFFHSIVADHEVAAGKRNYTAMELDTLRRRSYHAALARDGTATGERWRFLTLQNSWTVTTGAAGFPSRAKYRRDGDIVELRFLVTKTTGAITDVIATMPDGFLPFETVVRPCFYFNGTTFAVGMIQVAGRNSTTGTGGQVKWATGGSIAAGNINYIEFSYVADGG